MGGVCVQVLERAGGVGRVFLSGTGIINWRGAAPTITTPPHTPHTPGRRQSAVRPRVVGRPAEKAIRGGKALCGDGRARRGLEQLERPGRVLLEPLGVDVAHPARALERRARQQHAVALVVCRVLCVCALFALGGACASAVAFVLCARACVQRAAPKGQARRRRRRHSSLFPQSARKHTTHATHVHDDAQLADEIAFFKVR